MAQPTVRGYSYGASNSGTTCSVSAPTPMSVGNTLCMLIGASNNPTITMPAGWSKVGTSNTGTVRLEAWTKAVVSADIGRNINITLSGVQAIVGVCFVINNNDWSWDGSNDVPSDPLRVAASNSTNTPNPPNVAYGFSGRANVVLADYVIGNGASSTPPGHTGFPSDMPDSNYQYSTYNSNPDGVRHGWASLERSGGTSFDPDAFGTSRSELWRAATIVFRDQRSPIADFTVDEVPGFPLQRTFTARRNVGDPSVDSYAWAFTDDPGPFSGRVITHTFPGPGTYTVQLDMARGGLQSSAYQDVVIPATGAGISLDGQADGGGINVATLGLVVQIAGASTGLATNSGDIGRRRPLAGQSDSLGQALDATMGGGSTGLPPLHDMSWAYYLDLDSGDVYSQDIDGVYWKQGTIPGTGGGGSGGAPTTADYLTGSAQAGLSAEIVVGTTPGGELGGSWASPTVDASHSGSTHAATQAAAEGTAATALTGHAAAADPHTGYLQESVVSGMGVPAITLGTVASGGIATTAVRTDGTIVAFSDAVPPVPIAYGDTGQTGSNAFASRRDHRHAMVAAPAAERAASSTLPAAVGAAAIGTGTTDARADHVHPTGAGTPTTAAYSDTAQVGTGPAAAMSDHRHGMPAAGGATYAVPAVVLGTVAAAGAASTGIRSDSTIVAFDATNPVTQAYSDAPLPGTAVVAARRDHRHGMPASGGGGGAPTTSDYLVGTADAGLSNEIVVGTTPGGELGGTWASPTVDAAHSGSTHAAAQAAAEATAAAALAAAVPPGVIQMYGGAAAPTGWLLCDGSSQLRAGTYANLFTAIGTTFGSVDGTHFNVPDLRQRFPLGKAASGTGSVLGATGGAIDHTHTSANHGHPITAQSTGAALVAGTDDVGSATPTGSTINLTKRAHHHDITLGATDTNTPAATGANNDPFIVVNFIIRY